jgi:hypothetical protein
MPLRIDGSKLAIPAGHEETLPKAMFPNNSPSLVRAVPLLRWTELTDTLHKVNMGFETPTDGPHCALDERKT